MPTLHVRNVPEDLYKRIQSLAQIRKRSLHDQVIAMLYGAAQEEDNRDQQARTLVSIRRQRFIPPAGGSSSLELLGEDRRR